MKNNMSGKTGIATLIIAATVILVAALVLMLMPHRQPAVPPKSANGPKQSLLVYCAAGIKAPIEAIARAYEKEYGVEVQLQYGGSGTLLGNIRVAKAGDLFVAGDASFIRMGREQGVIAEAIPLAQMHPVIAVRAGNPKHIQNVNDLLREDVSVALANPEAASIGKVTEKLLGPSGTWAALKPRVKVFKPTVNDIANDVKLGAVDAGIVWDSTARQYPELQIVNDPILAGASETVMVGVLRASQRPTAALHFARYLAARDRGLPVFAQNHYEPVAGDAWADAPEIVLFSGAMLRPGIEKTLKEFEAREGCRITTVYNGCGILCAQMRAGERPDGYFSCDTSFMNSVADLYLTPENIVDNNLMILVQKGNPKGIRSVQDLLQPGLRVGLPHHEKSAMGNIAWKMLQQMNVYDALQQNMKVESPTGDFLVNQLRTGSLDAIIACRSNYVPVRDSLDAIAIDQPIAHMVQPYAVGRETRYKAMMTRLRDTLTDVESRERFQAVGFGWQYQAEATK